MLLLIFNPPPHMHFIMSLLCPSTKCILVSDYVLCPLLPQNLMAILVMYI
jgi:hypothetical protein